MRPTREQIAAIAQLCRTRPGEEVAGWLASELQITDTQLRKAAPEQLQRLQGRAQFLEELLQLWREAPDLAAKQR